MLATFVAVNSKSNRILWLSVLTLPLCAQTYEDLTTFRNQPMPYSQFIQVRAGALGSIAGVNSADAADSGLGDKIVADGSVFYHDAEFGGERKGQLDVYAGRDGVYAGVRDGDVVDGAVSRIELKAQIWPFYREGFYNDNQNFVPTGQYAGRDYEAYLGVGREVAEKLFIEVGSYYRLYQFSTDDATSSTYTVPNDYNAYGFRSYIEQRTTQLDRRSGLPLEGFCISLIIENEWNDSVGQFGSELFLSDLPKNVYRGRARLEWFIPQSTDCTWEVFATGIMVDDKDRVVEYETQHLQGSRWLDAQLRLRILFGDSVSLAPFVQGQYTSILTENGLNTDEQFFYGGGCDAWLHLSDMFSVNAWYSYVNNESRPSVSIFEDIHGEHMFYAGLVARFGAKR